MAGGKTGGHLFPGIAVAEILRERGWEVLFIGTREGLEEREIPPLGFKLMFIMAGGLKGKRFGETVKNLVLLPYALVQSLGIVLRHRVVAVVSLGGFAAGPVALAAWLSCRKVFVIEQNSIPGVTNRLVGYFADVIFTAFPDDRRMFRPSKVKQTGNPVRKTVLDALPVEIPSAGKPVLAIFGGSQGAHSINEVMVHIASTQPAFLTRFFIVHQTGERDVEMVRSVYAQHGILAIVEPFFRNIGGYYKAAAVIVCRAGATTIAELLALAKPAIYVPFPYATDDHQRYNARFVTAQGGGLMVEDAGPVEKRAECLIAAIERYEKEHLGWRQRLAAMRFADAAFAVATAIEETIRETR